jgi:hypothetical protein
MKILPILLAGSSLFFYSCTKSTNDDNGGTGGSNSGSSSFGEYVNIPEAQEDDAFTDLRVNNKGIYFKATKGSSNGSWIYRLEIGGPSPVWKIHKFDDVVFGYMPTLRTNEKSGEFSVYYYKLDKNGYVSYNSGTSFLEENSPIEGVTYFAGRPMVVDNSSQAYTWAFIDMNNSWAIKYRTGANNQGPVYDYVARSYNFANGIDVAEADDDDPTVWVGGGHYVYKVDLSGTIKEIDLSKLNPMGDFDYVKKIRVLNDIAWVSAGSKIYKITDNGVATIFTDLKGIAVALGGGDFAVDGQYMYTTDGEKIELATGKKTSLIPPAPTSGNQQELVNYYKMTGEFQSSFGIELSTDPLNPYLYTLTGDSKILKIKK